MKIFLTLFTLLISSASYAATNVVICKEGLQADNSYSSVVIATNSVTGELNKDLEAGYSNFTISAPAISVFYNSSVKTTTVTVCVTASRP